jgi:KDEL-tailed cysteine endopeptidase
MDVFYDHLSPEIASISSSWSRNDTSIAKKTIQSKVSESSIKNAVQIAQIVEKKAFDRARLSIQELIDCDTKYNQGCIGGNPVMALNFIHKYGIVSSAEYPYTGIENEKCQRDEMDTPIASTNSWGILKSKDEDSMEFALRHIGPICVGFDGSENSFLAYSGGIYDSNKCSNHPNHAMLITGYGQELDKYGEIVSILFVICMCIYLFLNTFV